MAVDVGERSGVEKKKRQQSKKKTHDRHTSLDNHTFAHSPADTHRYTIHTDTHTARRNPHTHTHTHTHRSIQYQTTRRLRKSDGAPTRSEADSTIHTPEPNWPTLPLARCSRKEGRRSSSSRKKEKDGSTAKSKGEER